MHLPTQERLHILESHTLTGVTNFHINNQIMYTNKHTAMQMQHAVHCKCSFTLLHGPSSLFALLPWAGRISANLLESPEEVSYRLSCRNNMTFLLPSNPTLYAVSGRQFLSSFLQMLLSPWLPEETQVISAAFSAYKGLRDETIHCRVEIESTPVTYCLFF